MKKHKKKLVIVSFIFSAVLLIYALRLEAIAWYFWHNAQSTHHHGELNLKNYHVVIDGLAIEGLANASGLTYNEDTNTLFTVLNKESKLIELSLKGEVIRTIHVDGVDDMEGITHIEDNQYVIADERDSRLLVIHLEDHATSVDVSNAKKIRLGMNEQGNKDFEGVSWDDREKRLLVVKERSPKYVLAVKGLASNANSEILNIEVEKLSQYDKMLSWAMRDLSSVNYLSKSGHMLLLSEESKLVKEFDENAKPLGALSLWKGFHGLKRSVPQAEGITTDTNDNIDIISEPNLFYVFSPK